MRLDDKLDRIESQVDRITQEQGRAEIDRLIRSREDATCSDCGHKVSEHGPDGCEHKRTEGGSTFLDCGCGAWTTEFDKEAHENLHGGAS
jgi:hypothetical protein